MKVFNLALASLFIVSPCLSGCAAKFLKIEEKDGQLAKIEEYDEKVKVKTLPVEPEVAQIVAPPSPESTVPTTLVPPPVQRRKK